MLAALQYLDLCCLLLSCDVSVHCVSRTDARIGLADSLARGVQVSDEVGSFSMVTPWPITHLDSLAEPRSYFEKVSKQLAAATTPRA